MSALKKRKLIVILHYEETRPEGHDRSRVTVSAGRMISYEGTSIPWFRITRHFVAATASLCREIAQREAFCDAVQ